MTWLIRNHDTEPAVSVGRCWFISKRLFNDLAFSLHSDHSPLAQVTGVGRVEGGQGGSFPLRLSTQRQSRLYI